MLKKMSDYFEKIEMCVEAYRYLINGLEIVIPQEGVLAGSQRFVQKQDYWKQVNHFQLFEMDNMHYPMGDACLKYGISGILELTADRRQDDTEETALYHKGINYIYKEVYVFIDKHAKRARKYSEDAHCYSEKRRLEQIAKNCEVLLKGKPNGFVEALQLFWFLYLIRGYNGGGCIGRLDQKLYPFYQMDIEKGLWDRDEVSSVILQFYKNLNDTATGDTLRNLMLSGQNSAGDDETNELTYLFLEAYEKMPKAEPHINVRFHKKTPQKLKDLCVRMLSAGSGQPTIYFDENIIPAMEKAGIAHEDACAYANDGCTETVYEGKSSIVFWQHEMVKTVELTIFNGEENPSIYRVKMQKNRKNAPFFEPRTELQTGYCSGKMEDMHSFSDFLEAFYAQLKFQINHWIEIIDKKIEEDEKDTFTSLFLAGTFEKSVLTGKDPLRGGGFDVDNYQLLSGTISTAADCLRAVEYSVYEQKFCTLIQLRDAMAVNFDGYELLRQRLLRAPKYGNGDRRVNEIASQIAQAFLNQVNAYRSKSGKRIRPGFYNIDFKIFANITGATPDGRRFRDPIGEHCSPTPGAAKCGPTAIIESASCLPMRQGYAASVLHLTLDKSSFLMGADKEKIIAQLLEASYKAGVPVWNLAMYSREELLDAKANPEKYLDLIVRVWGFNARFVELDEELQEHIINRIS